MNNDPAKYLLETLQRTNNSSDIFQTPDVALDYLLPFIPERVTTIWESACGRHRISKYFKMNGYAVVGTDILYGQDFFIEEPPEYDMQITNPPYSLKDEWLQRSYKLGKPFALLLPVNALHSIKRCNLFREYGVQLVIPPRRINFITPSGSGKGAWFPVMWFCYGMELENDLNFPNEQPKLSEEL